MINNCKIPGYDYSFEFHLINHNISNTKIEDTEYGMAYISPLKETELTPMER